MLQVGIVGLPNVGKSTLFNALTSAEAHADNYPFCTVEPNIGIVEVPDFRLGVIRALTGSASAVPAQVRFVDIAGLVRGASKGEGLGNRFLAQIREVDAVAHVLRCFHDPDVIHPMGSVDPLRDLEVLETELALADLETVERRKEKTEKKARAGDSKASRELAVLDRILETLSSGDSLRTSELLLEAEAIIPELRLLTAKPVLYVANVGEEGMETDPPVFVSLVEAGLERRGGSGLVKISSKIEVELAHLDPEDRAELISGLAWETEGGERLVRAAYSLLDLVTFFTSNDKECRAWPVRRGTLAPEAAGKVHTDFERGFIRAETIAYAELESAGSLKVAREKGLIRSEGKEYEVQDGDLMLFRFNV